MKENKQKTVDGQTPFSIWDNDGNQSGQRAQQAEQQQSARRLLLPSILWEDSLVNNDTLQMDERKFCVPFLFHKSSSQTWTTHFFSLSSGTTETELTQRPGPGSRLRNKKHLLSERILTKHKSHPGRRSLICLHERTRAKLQLLQIKTAYSRVQLIRNQYWESMRF